MPFHSLREGYCHQFRGLRSRVILKRCHLNLLVLSAVNPASIPTTMMMTMRNIMRSEWVECVEVRRPAMFSNIFPFT